MLSGSLQAAASSGWMLIYMWVYFNPNFYSAVSFHWGFSGYVEVGGRISLFRNWSTLLQCPSATSPPARPRPGILLTPALRRRATWWMLPDLQPRGEEVNSGGTWKRGSVSNKS